MDLTIDCIEFAIEGLRKGDQVAFYPSEDRTRYMVGFVTTTLPSGRVHIRVYDGNGSGVRKRVELPVSNRLVNRCLPLWVAHDLEDNAK